MAFDYTPSYVDQVINAIIAIVKRHEATEAAVLLGALRAQRARAHQDGTQLEVEAEIRYETSLRRQLGDQFDAPYTRGLALDETGMTELAFTQLAAIAEPPTTDTEDVSQRY